MQRTLILLAVALVALGTVATAEAHSVIYVPEVVDGVGGYCQEIPTGNVHHNFSPGQCPDPE
jgi:hypothetical protein